jgi:hypothetical protein
VKLQRHTVVPLGVCHLEQIDLGHGPCDIQERVDPTEAIECGIHNFSSGCWFMEIKRQNQIFSSQGFRLLGCLLEVRLVPCDQNEG